MKKPPVELVGMIVLTLIVVYFVIGAGAIVRGGRAPTQPTRP